LLVLVEYGGTSLRALLVHAIQASNYTLLESENAVIFEPEEHNLLEVSLCCLEQRLQFVQLTQLDDFEDFARVLDQLQHGQVIEVEIVNDLAEGLVLHLPVEVDDQFLILASLLRDLLEEYLLKVD